jgi:pimeloyl-ACP methyl ester carboxylesterase
VIAQFAGDGFMAIFGAPIAHDDDAARACRAALGIQAELRVLSREWQERHGQRIEGRIGLNTGLAIVGSVGSDLRMEYSAIGDTTNVASRIEAFAPPGEIFVSETTRKLVAHEFETEEVASEAFKGKSETTTVFRLLRAVSRSERRHQALRAGLSRYVGRGTELSLLGARLEEAAGGSGQVVFLAGEAGIGKSRLVHEFRRRLDEDTHWLEGQCVSYGVSISHLPIADLLRGFFEIDEADSAERIVEKVSERCARLGGPVKDGEPFYRDLLGVDPGDERLARMEERLKSGHFFESVRNLVHALAQENPVVLLLEDVHWIDASSEQLLRRLFDTLAGARVLVIATHRSEYRWPHGERSYFARVQLRGLGEELVDELARSVLARDRIPRELKRIIAQRSDGNPFFIEEVVKSLDERGLLDGQDADEGVWDQVPATVQEVLLARIDRLHEEAKRTLQIASVIGREFTLRLLERVAEAQDAPELVDELRGLELIYEKSVYPELAYMFKHALTHDVAYSTLLESQRRRLHATVARLIEELYTARLPEFYETLAFQYRQAEMFEEAARYALLSAGRASQHLAPEAEQHFRRAAKWSRGRESCADIFVRSQIGLADHLMRQGELDAGNETLRETLEVVDDSEMQRFLRNKIVERRFAERDGARLAYYIHGEGRDGDPSEIVPYVVMHPIIQGSYSFQDYAQRLCQEHCVIYFDSRGTGSSDPYPANFDFDICVADHIAILDSLPYRRFNLHGDSDGVPLTLEVYHAMPKRVANLILFGFYPVGLLCPDHPTAAAEQRDGFAKLFLDVDQRTSLENFVNLMANEPGMSAWRELFVDDLLEHLDDEFLKAFFRQAGSHDLRPRLPGVRVPTLVIAAERDGIPVEEVRGIAEGISGAHWAVIKDSSHYANWTAIETFREIVTTFLREGALPKVEWQP